MPDDKVATATGTGIGLAFAKSLAEAHQGSLRLEDNEPQGSSFVLSLPLNKEAVEETTDIVEVHSESEGTTENISSEFSGKKFTVLLVEDNVELLNLTRDSLLAWFRVLKASNGRAALEILEQESVDVIVSDVMMPVMDGLDMVKAIKADHNTCHIPIILLSAKSSLDDRIAGLEQGIDDYITKPFSSTYLKTRILSLLRQRKQLQDLYLSKLSEHTQEEDHINGWEPSQPQVTPYDEQFMQQVMAFMEEQMDNTDITIDDFANKLMLSRTVFYRKLKSIVGLTPVDFVCEMRIKRAAQLIEKSEYSFSQIAYMTGFNDPKYFSRRFKKIMGVTPTEYKERKGDAS